MTEKEWDEARCCACGCYMEEIDCSTEVGYDYDFRCNNSRCKSKKDTKENKY